MFYISGMGFYATTAECTCREKMHPPSKNRVVGSRATLHNRARKIPSQVLEPQQENQPTPTPTASGVHYYGYRYYNPALGRWVNRDPIEEKGGVNVYGFVGNSPLSQFDSHGLSGFPGEPDLSDVVDDLWGENPVLSPIAISIIRNRFADFISRTGYCLITDSNIDVSRRIVETEAEYWWFGDRYGNPVDPQRTVSTFSFETHLMTIDGPIDTCDCKCPVLFLEVYESFVLDIFLGARGDWLPSASEWALRGLLHELLFQEELFLRLEMNGWVLIYECREE